jgi:hypothetical protein
MNHHLFWAYHDVIICMPCLWKNDESCRFVLLAWCFIWHDFLLSIKRNPGRPAWPVLGPVRAPFDLGARLFIASASVGRHIHPFIREPPTRRRSRLEGADSCRKSSSCLGDGLGHALATMVGPAWWSHDGVPESWLEFVKSFVPSTFDGDINQFLSLLWSTTSCAYSYV